MKKLSFLLISIGLCSLFSACQKNNYVQNIPAPHFTYFESDKTVGKTELVKEVEEPKEEITAQLPVLYTSSENVIDISTENMADVKIATTDVTKQTTKSVSKVATTKKPSFKEKMIGKVVSKRIQKMSNGATVQEGKTNTMALISGVAGLLGLGLLFVPSLGAVAILLGLGAIITGFIGKSQIKRSGEKGNGWAITGIVSGILIFFILLLAVVFVASLLAL
jgi:hypothetical protein